MSSDQTCLQRCSLAALCSMDACLLVLISLAVAVSSAAPLAGDGVSNPPDATSQPTAVRLVTGDAPNLQAVVAGTPPTTIIQIVPIPPRVPQPVAYTISGNQLNALDGGFRAWFQMQVGHWDPNGDGPVPDHPGVVEVKMDGTGYMSGQGSDLARPMVPCVNNTACRTAFGETYAKCELGFCTDAYADRAGVEPQSFCSDFGFGSCNQGDCATTSPNLTCFAITEAPRPDDGNMKSFANVVIDVPAGAKGLYTVPLLTDATYLASSTVPPEEIQSLAEIGLQVHIALGKCCYGLGSPSAGCVSDVLQSECGDDEPAPFLWTGASDLDLDGDVDLSDFASLRQCLSGPGTPNTIPTCVDSDLNADERVDLRDCEELQRCFSGSDSPVEPGCGY